jgi:hypothetical protein
LTPSRPSIDIVLLKSAMITSTRSTTVLYNETLTIGMRHRARTVMEEVWCFILRN